MVRQKYSNDNYIVSVEEDEVAYLDALKDGIDIGCAIKIKVQNTKGEYKGLYSKVWEDDITPLVLSSFVRKFLENPKFRKDYLVEGEGFEDTISYTDESGVNIRCKRSIETFYKTKSKKGFKDYAQLKTYGADKFSRMKLDKLEQVLDRNSVSKAKREFDDDKLLLSTLRWCCRGLLIDDAIVKVKTDLEISNNRFTRTV